MPGGTRRKSTGLGQGAQGVGGGCRQGPLLWLLLDGMGEAGQVGLGLAGLNHFSGAGSGGREVMDERRGRRSGRARSGWAALRLKGVLPGELFTLSREWLTRGGRSRLGQRGRRGQSIRTTEKKTWLIQGGPVLPSRCSGCVRRVEGPGFRWEVPQQSLWEGPPPGFSPERKLRSLFCKGRAPQGVRVAAAAAALCPLKPTGLGLCRWGPSRAYAGLRTSGPEATGCCIIGLACLHLSCCLSF